MTDLTGTLFGSGALVSSISLTFDLQATGQVSIAHSPLRYRPTKRWAQQEVDWRAYTDRMVIFPLNVPTDVTATAAMTISLGGILTGVAAMAATAAQTITLTGTLLGQGALAGTLPMTLSLSGTLSGTQSGGISGVAAMTLDLSGALTGIGALESTPLVQFVLTGTPTATVAIFATAAMQLSLSGMLTDISSGGVQPASARRTLRARRRFQAITLH